MCRWFRFLFVLSFCFCRSVPGVEINIHGGELLQSIDGFGACTRFGDGGRHELFFSKEKGIGLSLCRTPVPQDGSVPDLEITQAAQAYGAKVWSSSWSPPAKMKTNNDVNGGGSLLAAQYQAYADFLADYVAACKAKGIDLYALSIQNEPNVSTNYASCIWTAQQFHDFIKNNLGPTFRRRSIGAMIMAPEYSGWNFDLAEPSLDDPVSRDMVSIMAAHTYKPDDKTKPYQKALDYGKRQWQTEVCSVKAIDRTMEDALRWVQEIHVMLTKTRINSWSYWLLDGATKDNNEGLWAQGPTKRLYAMGNYARFARPGFVVVGAVSASPDILVTAFKDTSGTGKVAIVAANKGAADVVCEFSLDRLPVTALTPWETSSRFDLAQRPEIKIIGGRFSVTLTAKSITSFAGTTIGGTWISARSSGARRGRGKNRLLFQERGMPVFSWGESSLPAGGVSLPDGRTP